MPVRFGSTDRHGYYVRGCLAVVIVMEGSVQYRSQELCVLAGIESEEYSPWKCGTHRCTCESKMAKRIKSLKISKVEFSLPWGIGKVELQPDPTVKRAAWVLYIELVTRIAVEPMPFNEGVLREALSSLYSLFKTTRDVLRDAGPNVGISASTLGGIAIGVLNRGLRPFLSYWHPALQSWEDRKPQGASPQEHEKQWPEEERLRTELEKLSGELQEYADALGKIAGVEALEN
jgi:hypothetical protein